MVFPELMVDHVHVKFGDPWLHWFLRHHVEKTNKSTPAKLTPHTGLQPVHKQIRTAWTQSK